MSETDSPSPDECCPKTVQQYIDETPAWPDGTPAPSAPMTVMQWRIWALASAGKFFEGLVVFMTGVALPLIVREFGLGAMEKGAVGAAPLFGILVGASALGGLSDRFGRKFMFIVEMALFTLFLSLLVFSPSYHLLLVYLFGLGLALGCDYPTAHMVISESIPSTDRGRLVLSAFGFQAVGALAGTGVGWLILSDAPSIHSWRMMYGTAVIPAVLVLIGRFFITDSSHWLVSRGSIKRAEHEILRLLKRKPPYPREVRLLALEKPEERQRERGGYLRLFSSKYRRACILASVPWFLQDLSTYGIGIFTPTILAAALGAETVHPHNITALIHKDMLAAQGSAFIDILLLVGIVIAVLLADRAGRIRMQVIGFVGCAAGLVLAVLSRTMHGGLSLFLLCTGFMLFNLMTNLGPNSMTYLLAGEVFPTRVRGLGAGFAASFAKIGAVCTAFFFPVLLKVLGTETLLIILAGCSLAGALVTWSFRIETTGVSLEDIGRDLPVDES